MKCKVVLNFPKDVVAAGNPQPDALAKQIADDFKNQLIAWMQGFISGLNYTLYNTSNYIQLGSLSPDAQFEIVLSKCKENGDKPFFIAVDEMSKMLGTGKPK